MGSCTFASSSRSTRRLWASGTRHHARTDARTDLLQLAIVQRNLKTMKGIPTICLSSCRAPLNCASFLSFNSLAVSGDETTVFFCWLQFLTSVVTGCAVRIQRSRESAYRLLPGTAVGKLQGTEMIQIRSPKRGGGMCLVRFLVA